MKTQVIRLLKKFPPAAVCALALLLAGCNDPAEFLLWSPDGQHGLVVGGNEIVLVDATGTIVGKPFAPKAPVGVEAWMPDSHRVLAVRSVKAKNWSEIAPLLGAERAQSVIRAADEMLGIIRTYRGDLSKIDEDPRFKPWSERLDFAAHYSIGSGSSSAGWEGITTVLAYLRERHAAEIAPLLQTKEMADESDSAPEIYELFLRNVLPGEAPAEQLLLRSADVISWAQPSPDGRMIAFVRNEPERPALCIVGSQGGGDPVPVDEGGAQAAWTPDGQALVYQKTTVPFSAVEKQAQLGTLTRRQVRDAAGAVPAKLADAEDLAGVLFSNEQNRVACLPDGRILFVSAELSLPAVETARDLTLFALRPGATRVIERVVSEAGRAGLPGRIDRFTVSPDGRHVALPGGSGEVAVLSLATGEVTPIQSEALADYRDSSRYENSATPPAPAWRSATELCYIVPAGSTAGSARRAEAVRQPLGGAPRTISRDWSDELTTGFLPRPKP